MDLFVVGIIAAAAFAFVIYPLVSPRRHLYYLDDMLGANEQKKLNYLYARRNVVYDNLRDLDNEFQMGKLSQDDHQRLRDGLMAEAAGIVKEIDEAHIRREVEDAIETDVRSKRRLS
ncbi:MAG TPA: hypothetical protein VJS69_15070 [Candidatus Krumholzibacteria bacterium]|nr:hypothetical protein [Candidatus Krumholzibacteria bacterium]